MPNIFHRHRFRRIRVQNLPGCTQHRARLVLVLQTGERLGAWCWSTETRLGAGLVWAPRSRFDLVLVWSGIRSPGAGLVWIADTPLTMLPSVHGRFEMSDLGGSVSFTEFIIQWNTHRSYDSVIQLASVRALVWSGVRALVWSSLAPRAAALVWSGHPDPD